MNGHSITEIPWIIWRLSDGKAGHDAQSVGLVKALERIHPICEHLVTPRRMPLQDLLVRRFPGSSGYPDPDLLIGAGHSTHLSLIAAQRARGGKTIVLMKPTLPTFFFDLCIIPDHDRAPQAKNVLVTQGVLNAVQSSTKLSPRRGLMLIGGPSKHFGWSDTGIAAQVKEIISSTPETDWTLTTSRRTPAGFLQIASELKASNLRIVPVEDTKQGWVTKQMATSGQIWVSEESASMIYEALSSGAGVGLLSCPSQRPSRITEGVRTLKYKGYVTPFSSWRPGDALQAPTETLAEADRCARWIAGHWFGIST